MLVGETYNSPVLTDYVVKYENDAVVGTRALPYVPHFKLEGKYTVFDKKNRFKREDTRRGHLSKAGHSDTKVNRETFSCEGFAWREFMPYVDYDNAEPPVRDQMGKADACVNTVLLDQEVRIAEQIFAAATYPTAQKMTLTAGGTSDGYQLDQYASGAGTFFPIIEAAIAKCYRPPNADLVVLINPESWQIIKHHPDVLARVSGGATTEMPAAVLKRVVAELIEADEILVGGAKYDGTSKRSTGSYEYIWGRHMLVFYRAKSPSRDATQLGSTFIYTPELSPKGSQTIQVPGAQQGWRARTYEDLETGGGGLWVEVENWVTEKLVALDCACLIQDCIGSTTPTTS
jgi:hypothetical protein